MFLCGSVSVFGDLIQGIWQHCMIQRIWCNYKVPVAPTHIVLWIVLSLVAMYLLVNAGHQIIGPYLRVRRNTAVYIQKAIIQRRLLNALFSHQFNLGCWITPRYFTLECGSGIRVALSWCISFILVGFMPRLHLGTLRHTCINAASIISLIMGKPSPSSTTCISKVYRSTVPIISWRAFPWIRLWSKRPNIVERGWWAVAP